MGVARRSTATFGVASSHTSIDLNGPVDVHDELIRHGESHRAEHQRESVGDDEHVPEQAEEETKKKAKKKVQKSATAS